MTQQQRDELARASTPENVERLRDSLWQAMRALEAAEPRVVNPEGNLWQLWVAALAPFKGVKP